ncbi:hypothetical protein [Streptomyces sp. JW3]|uniref:hypothetical protein n=1 Tax=Streptomyces sp. JW3 TaxID=3456955 RepID=UPI003FA4D2EB
MAVTNDDLLAKDGEILRAVESVRASIPGTGSDRLTTETFLTAQIAELKKSAGATGTKTPAAATQQKEPGVVETLAQTFFGKELIDSVKGMFTSSITLKSTVVLGIALTTALGLQLFSLSGLIKDVLASKNKEIVTKFGIPRVKDTTPEPDPHGPNLPNMLDLASALHKVDTSVKTLDTSVGGLHRKVDSLLAQLS